MSAHGPREEFVEEAWRELATQLDLTGKHCGWFHAWFDKKLIQAVAVVEHETMRKLIEEKDRHTRTQEWLDRFQGTVSEQALAIVDLTEQVTKLKAAGYVVRGNVG